MWRSPALFQNKYMHLRSKIERDSVRRDILQGMSHSAMDVINNNDMNQHGVAVQKTLTPQVSVRMINKELVMQNNQFVRSYSNAVSENNHGTRDKLLGNQNDFM